MPLGLSYRYEWPNIPDAKAYSYELISPVPAVDYPITLAELKSHLRVDDTVDDEYLNLVIKAVTHFGEQYTKRDFINKTYKTYRDFFKRFFIIRRAPLVSITSIKYFVKGLENTIASTVYFATKSNAYSDVALKLDQVWPSDVDRVEDSIVIEFIAGYGATALPDAQTDLKFALFNHAAQIYENRGDCSECSCRTLLPMNARDIYNQYRIMSI